MSIQTIRITVNNVAALDGASELPVAPTLGAPLSEGGVIEVVTDQPFGRLDPGQFTTQQNQNLMVAAITVISEGAAVLPVGSVVNVVSPDRIGGGVVARQVIDLNASTAGSGIVLKSDIVVPVDHKVGFVGPSAGPHVIQVTLVPLTDAFIQHASSSSTPAAVACANTVVVQSESDLPAAVANVITLVDNTRYHICGTVALSGANRISMGTNTPIQGASRLVDGFTGSAPVPFGLISATGDLDLDVRNLNIVNDTGKALSGPVSLVSAINIIDCDLTGAAGGTMTVAGGAHLTFLRNIVDATPVGGGLSFALTGTAYRVHNNTFTSAVADVAAIQVLGNTTVSMLDISDNTFLGDPSASHVQFIAPPTIQLTSITGNTFSTNSPAFSGFDQSTPGVRAFNNTGGSGPVIDTVRQGGISIIGNAGGVETAIAVQGTFVRIGTGNPGTHPLYVLDGASERFSLVGATADVQTIRYDGTIRFQGILSLYLTGIEVPAIADVGVSARLVQDPTGAPPPVVIAQSTIEGGTSGVGGESGAMSWAVPIVVEPLDEFYIEIANDSGIDNLVFSAARITLYGTAV